MPKFDKEPPVRCYIHTGEAWYASTSLNAEKLDEVMIGDYPDGGGTNGEFAIVWVDVSESKPTPRIEAFDDSWAMLSYCHDLIEALAQHDNQNIEPKQLCELLDRLGFKDKTERTRPA